MASASSGTRSARSPRSSWPGRRAGADENWTNRQAVANRIQQIERVIGRFQIWQDQQVGTAFQLRIREDTLPDGRVYGGIGMHLAFDLQFRRDLFQHRHGFAHLDGRFSVRGSEIGV